MKLYIVEADHGRCKIGVTNDFPRRLKQLESAGGFNTTNSQVYELGTMARAVEKRSHGLLKAFRLRTNTTNTEWFDCCFSETIRAVTYAIGELRAQSAECAEGMLGSHRRSVGQLVLHWWRHCLETGTMPCKARHLFDYEQDDDRILDVSGVWTEYSSVILPKHLLVSSFYWFVSKDSSEETDKEHRTRMRSVSQMPDYLIARRLCQDFEDARTILVKDIGTCRKLTEAARW